MDYPSNFIPLPEFQEYSAEEMEQRARAFYEDVAKRRTIREFSERPVPQSVVEQCLLAAGTAPNGANLQPWHFVVVSDQDLKHQIRVEAEIEEHEFYNGRAPKEWLDALAPLGTDEDKPFLEVAPYLIVIFSKTHELNDDGSKVKNYYASESTGIATGMLITALHRAGVATLTHTPSPMKFLNKILGRPSNERPFLVLVAGFPADDVHVPDITKKPLDKIATFL